VWWVTLYIIYRYTCSWNLVFVNLDWTFKGNAVHINQ
jgi:hypothetical protein